MIEQITEHISFDRGFNKGYDVGHKKVNELTHRLKCIEEDIQVIANFIEKSYLNDEFKKTTGYAEQAWHHISNIEIACDLNDDAPNEWSCASCK